MVRNELRPAEEVEQSCSSSVGKNSDCSDSDGGDSPEVQSRMKGPLETMDSLEDSLPIKYLFGGIALIYLKKKFQFLCLHGVCFNAMKFEVFLNSCDWELRLSTFVVYANYLKER